MADFLDKLKELEPTAEALNRESEHLNSTIEAIETRLSELRLGVVASVVLDEVQDDELVTVTSLAYARIDGRWGLWVTEETSQGNVYGPRSNSLVWPPEHRRLLDASREIRVESVERMPQLIDRLKANAEQRIERFRAARMNLGD